MWRWLVFPFKALTCIQRMFMNYSKASVHLKGNLLESKTFTGRKQDALLLFNSINRRLQKPRRVKRRCPNLLRIFDQNEHIDFFPKGCNGLEPNLAAYYLIDNEAKLERFVKVLIRLGRSNGCFRNISPPSEVDATEEIKFFNNIAGPLLKHCYILSRFDTALYTGKMALLNKPGILIPLLNPRLI